MRSRREMRPHSTRYPNQRSLEDPDVMEDVMFLIEDGCQLEEVARRCNVGYWALVKSGIHERQEDEAIWLRRFRLWPG